MDDFKKTEFSRHKRADAHTNSERLLQHAQELHKLKPDKSQNGRGDVAMKYNS